jgi:putative peptidoglycan lipid II flippase
MRDLFKNSTELLFRRQTNILSAAFVIMVTYAMSHLMGLVKTRLLISYFFSKAHLLDAYYGAFVIPDTIFQLLVIGSLSAAFIPTFTRYITKKDVKTAWHVASSSLNLVLLVFSVISVVIFIFSKNLSLLIAPGFSAVQINTMSDLLRVMLVAQVFFCISGFLTGIIQSNQRFLIPAMAPIVYNLGIILGIVFLSPKIGIFGPAVGVVIGSIFHMLIQLPLALKLGFKFSASLDIRHEGVREVLKLIPPRVLALGIDQIEQFIAVVISSILIPGSFTLLNVARLLYAIPSSLFGVTIGQAALPTLSRISLETDRKGFAEIVIDSLLQIVFFALPISIMFIVLRIPVVRIVFGAQSFPWSATILTGKMLAVLTLSAVSSAVIQLTIRAFYALHDTKTPLYIGFFCALFNGALSLLLVKVFDLGIIGLAFAITMTAIIEGFILTWYLYKKIHWEHSLSLNLFSSLLRMLFAGLITGISLWIPMRFLDQFIFDTTRTLPLVALTVLTSAIGFSSYFVFSYLFQVKELTSLVSLIRRVTRFKNILLPQSKEVLIVSAPDQN